MTHTLLKIQRGTEILHTTWSLSDAYAYLLQHGLVGRATIVPCGAYIMVGG